MARTRIAPASIIAVVLIFASTAGGAARQQSDSETVSVTLSDQLCSIDIYASDGSFGTWRWWGTSYQLDRGDSIVTIQGDLRAAPRDTCDVTVSFAGITGPGGTIDTSHFGAFSFYTGRRAEPSGWTHIGVAPAIFNNEYDFQFQLVDVPANMPPGRYQGLVHITVANSA